MGILRAPSDFDGRCAGETQSEDLAPNPCCLCCRVLGELAHTAYSIFISYSTSDLIVQTWRWLGDLQI